MIGSLEVSVVGLGTNTFGTDWFSNPCDQEGATAVVNAALEAGVTFFDTAEEYSITTLSLGTGHAEQFLRAALGKRRDDVVIASKFLPRLDTAPGEWGATRIVRAVEGSLTRLGTDRIDLYQQHQPDPETPIDEILEALGRLVRDGKVREIGCSNFSGEMIDEAVEHAAAAGTTTFASAQNRYNVLDQPRQSGVIEAIERHHMMLLPYFPLASGLLTGKYRRGEGPSGDARLGGDAFANRIFREGLSDDRFTKVEALSVYAEERGHTLLELAISWLTSRPFVGSVIAGATRPDQIAANVAAASWDLTLDDFAAVDEVLR